MRRNVPVKRPTPDARRFIDALLGRVRTQKPPLVEYLVDDAVMKPIVTGLLGRGWVDDAGGGASQTAYLDNYIELWYRMGYDFVRFERGLPFAENQLLAADVSAASQQRAWVDEHHGTIATWRDFERYPWPQVEEFDFFPFDYLAAHLPDGMGLMTCHAGGIFEHLSSIMSFEGLCAALIENRALVKAVADKVGQLMARFYEHLLDLPNLVAIFQGDDMGFRTGTLISPADLRRYCLPWHKRFAAMAHERGVPYFLHSCGNIEAIMEDLIADVCIDGKHSFEDVIMPVEEFQARYGGRIAVLGGVDVNILAAGLPEHVRERTRQLVETCGERGRFAIGSGNSIPSYVPVTNYLAMLDEALGFAS
jgi:uroporphyrinogen decarboxylase